jgi:hypothetical protein
LKASNFCASSGRSEPIPQLGFPLWVTGEQRKGSFLLTWAKSHVVVCKPPISVGWHKTGWTAGWKLSSEINGRYRSPNGKPNTSPQLILSQGTLLRPRAAFPELCIQHVKSAQFAQFGNEHIDH